MDVFCIFDANPAATPQSYGVYLSYYLSNSVFPSASPLDYAFIGGLTFAFAFAMAPVAMRLCRLLDFRIPMLVGVFCQAGGFVAASLARRIWELYLSQGVLVGVGVGLVYIPSLPVISHWFGRHRSLANGIAAAGSGIGGLGMSFAMQAMIQNLGVGWALRITGLICFPATLLLRSRDADVKPSCKMFDMRLLKR